jgi:KDO2-lipid IV(A) lauroyltransferase
MSGWKKFRRYLEYRGCWLLAHSVPLLPRRACVALANFVGYVAFRLDSRGRKVAVANLEAAFPGRFSTKQRSAIAHRSYRDFARTMLDLFWAPRLLKNPEQFLHLEGLDNLEQLQREKKSAVLLCVHSGGFEWANLAIGLQGITTTVVAAGFDNASLARLFAEARSVTGQRMIPQESSMVRLLKHVKRGGFAGMLIDLNLPPSQASAAIDAFGMKMCVTFLHAILALRGGAALIPVDTRLNDDGSCRIIVHPPLSYPEGSSPAQVTQFCWDFFERLIEVEPERWMWAYKHWRYRPKNAERAYPFYANVSPHFEKLLERQAEA